MDFDKIKLIIWDLDDTFWCGTLSEGGITYLQDRHRMVMELNQCGIMNSICSNNDFELVQRIMEDHCIWGQFLFPAVSWSPKPKMILTIIEQMQLRPQNVVFLDDKARIREEVRTIIPNLLHTCSAEDFSVAYKKRIDESKYHPDTSPIKKRFENYKTLERKYKAKQLLGDVETDSSVSFLKESKIECRIFRAEVIHRERIFELINRTNQLNFTRKRLSDISEVNTLVDSNCFLAGLIEVKDNYGDYGICGFYAISRSTLRLVHFLFSCRILQMGVEEAVYRYLKSPGIDPSDETGRVEFIPSADAEVGSWVQIHDRQARADLRIPKMKKKIVKLHFTGGCDLQSIVGILNANYKDVLNIDLQTTFHSKDGRFISSVGASSLLMLAKNPDQVIKFRTELEKISWLAEASFHSPIFSNEYDGYIVSPQRDGFLAHYEHRSGEFSIPVEFFRAGCRSFENELDWPILSERISKRNGPMSSGLALYMRDHYHFRGCHSEETYRKFLTWLIDNTTKSLVFLSLADITAGWGNLKTVDWLSLGDMIAEAEHHKLINKALVDMATPGSRLSIVDVRKRIRSTNDVVDLNHFRRGATVGIAFDLINQLKCLGLIIDSSRLSSVVAPSDLEII